MEEAFKIFVDQLREGRETHIEETYSPEFLDLTEEGLAFEKEVKLDGVAYLAEDELILNWNIETEATLPCKICNEKVFVPIKIENFYHGEPLESIKTGIYNFKDLLRETIILEAPPFTECNQGNCPNRGEIAEYLKDSSEEELDDEEGYKPFADIDWKP